MSDEQEPKNEVEYIKHAHIRLRCGLEILGVMVIINDQLVIDRPVRIEYREDGSVKLLPLSYFSDAEFFVVDNEIISFNFTMNDSSFNRYEEFCKDFADHIKKDDDLDSLSVQPDETIH